MTVTWDLVDGAIGYVLLRGPADAAAADDLVVVDHGGGDLLAVDGPPYVDTSAPVEPSCFAVAAIASAEAPHGPPSRVVIAAPLPPAATSPRVDVVVDSAAMQARLARPWWMIGSEYLSQLEEKGGLGRASIGEEFATALGRAATDLGVTHVRAHAILDDRNDVYGEADGQAIHRFDAIDRVYDQILALGLRPIVELGFMPTALAEDPDSTVFSYRAIVSPPKDLRRWGKLVGALATHLVDRYGMDEVRTWAFEVWNEPNLQVFWTGSRRDYLDLYDATAHAVKAVDADLRIGGPATAAVGWIDAFLDHIQTTGTPLDFLSTHVYGTWPLDVRQAMRRRGMAEVPVWWTEWGITPTHFAAVNDAAFGAPFVLHGMKRAQRVCDALSYWVISDHFEELGRPPSLLHGGFGLQTVGNLRKPRFWALHLAASQGPTKLELTMSGDGAHGLIEGWATRHDDGTIDVLVWNGTFDQRLVDGDPALDRVIDLHIHSLPGRSVAVSIARIGIGVSDIASRLPADVDWPAGEAEWQQLQAEDRLHVDHLGTKRVSDGVVKLPVELPMPGVIRVRVTTA